MQFKTLIMILLSALISAAPIVVPSSEVAEANFEVASTEVEFIKRDESAHIFPRQATCNAPRPPASNAAATKKYTDNMKAMSAATKAAHAGEKQCRPSRFNLSRNKNEKARIKGKCVADYQICVTERTKANAACKAAGGTVDKGHKDALQFCKAKVNEWKAKKVT